MKQDRRSFFRLLRAGAVATPVVAAAAVSAPQAPRDAIQEYPNPVQVVTPNGQSPAEAVLGMAANAVADAMRDCLASARKPILFGYEKSVAQRGDTIHLPYFERGLIRTERVSLTQHTEATFLPPYNFLTNRELLVLMCRPACIALYEHIENDVSNTLDPLVVMRQHPALIPGLGALSTRFEIPEHDFGGRVIMAYNPDSLAVHFTIDLLYGCTSKRHEHSMRALFHG